MIGTTYQISPEHETIALARGYRIEKDRSGEYFCLRGSETGKRNSDLNLLFRVVLQRKAVKAKQLKKPQGLQGQQHQDNQGKMRENNVQRRESNPLYESVAQS